MRENKYDDALAALTAIPKAEHLAKTRAALSKLLTTRLRGKSARTTREIAEIISNHSYVLLAAYFLDLLTCFRSILSQFSSAYSAYNEILQLGVGTTTANVEIDETECTTASLLYFRACRLSAENKPLQALNVLKGYTRPNAR